MQIRVANSADAADIARVHVETWQLAYTEIMPARVLAALDIDRRTVLWAEQLSTGKSDVFVTEVDGRIVAFCEVMPSRDEDADPRQTAELVVMYVHPSHGRKGLGRALWQHALDDARRRGRTMVTLWVLTANVAARRFYETLGFSRDGTTGVYRLNDGTKMEKLRYRIAI